MFLYHEIHAIMEFKVHQPSRVKKTRRKEERKCKKRKADNGYP